MRLLMIIWLVLLPFTLGTELKWGIVAITSVTAWTMLQVSEQRHHVTPSLALHTRHTRYASHLQVEEIAVQIEDPFGSKANDLPLEAYTLAVQADVLRLLDEASIGASSRGLAGALSPRRPTARPRPPARARQHRRRQLITAERRLRAAWAHYNRHNRVGTTMPALERLRSEPFNPK